MGIAIDSQPETAPGLPNDPDEDRELRRLMMLAENSPQKVWEYVQRYPTNVNYKVSPLILASDKNWLRVGAWLLKQAEKTKADLDYIPGAALENAVRNGNRDFCELLHRHGVAVSAAGESLVHAIQHTDGFPIETAYRPQ